jgi:hypothetical protein
LLPPEVAPETRRRRLLAVIAAITVVIVTAAAVLAYLWRASFQPLGYGSTSVSTEYYPGLPTGTGIRTVNTFGFLREDVYIPPQPGAFSLFVDLANDGGRSVTIESVTLPRGGPLTMAGPVVYARPGGGYGQPAIPLRHSILRNVVLAPGHEIYIGLLVRSWPCAIDDSWAAVPAVNVTYRFLVFTHTVAVAWGLKNDELILRSPAGRPGQPGITCAGR